MFEKASRLKLRFAHKGLCSVEDLWDLPLPALDTVFKALNVQSKASNEESLLETKSQEDEVLALKIAVVRHIAKVRQEEQRALMGAAMKAEKKQKLLGIIARKQEAALEEMSVEDLGKLVGEL